MLLVVLALLAAMWAGLLRMGWVWPPLRPSLAAVHGPLMVSGFVGTLIGLERAVALGKKWAYTAPLLTGLGGLALLVLCLACIGLFGIMSYAVSQRTNELGIRIALGAERGEILKLVIKGCLELSGKGILIGLLLSIPIGILMASNLYGVGGLDPLTYGGVILLLLAVAFAAGYLPARKATRIDPMLALRYE